VWLDSAEGRDGGAQLCAGAEAPGRGLIIRKYAALSLPQGVRKTLANVILGKYVKGENIQEKRSNRKDKGKI
jgi:hypothetical protein